MNQARIPFKWHGDHTAIGQLDANLFVGHINRNRDRVPFKH
jgi:hypothetical protein